MKMFIRILILSGFLGILRISTASACCSNRGWGNEGSLQKDNKTTVCDNSRTGTNVKSPCQERKHKSASVPGRCRCTVPHCSLTVWNGDENSSYRDIAFLGMITNIHRLSSYIGIPEAPPPDDIRI